MRLLIYLLLTLLLSACDLFGTNGGNPAGVGTGNGDENSRANPTVSDISTNVCAKIKTCYPASSEDTCVASLATNARVPPLLGLDVSQFADLNAIKAADTSGALNIDTSSATSCLAAVTDLACSSLTVTSTYGTSQPNDYSNVSGLLGASAKCADFFVGH